MTIYLQGVPRPRSRLDVGDEVDTKLTVSSGPTSRGEAICEDPVRLIAKLVLLAPHQDSVTVITYPFDTSAET